MSEKDKTTILSLNFSGGRLIPAITQDSKSKDILMLAWMNEDAFKKTLETGEAHYWSRSRGELWHKGATSGAIQTVNEIHIDCDQDTILLLVDQKGGACHTGRQSCFYRRVIRNADGRISLQFDDEAE